MKIMKFGGTSIGKSQRMKDIVNLVNNEERKIIVLSAISGTTDNLEKIFKALKKDNLKKAKKYIKDMIIEYHSFIDELYETEEYKIIANKFTEKVFNDLDKLLLDVISDENAKRILSAGEILSTNIFNILLKERNIESILLPAFDIIKLDENDEPDTISIKINIENYLSKFYNNNLFITQGYICTNKNGEIDNLKRGGSDYTASILGEATNADEVQIWTDVDGFYNNDPRYVSDINVIKKLSFNEAAELAYFGAEILHPSSVLPCQRNDIPVILKNSFNPNAKGTIITKNSEVKNFKAIAAKDNITAIKIKSDRMLMAYGFLKKVFEVFENYSTPVDMISTSEVAVSLTIDDMSNLNSIIEELKKIAKVEIAYNQTIVCIVGDFSSNNKACCLKILDCLKDIPIRMISYGGSKFNISVLIKNTYKQEALLSLNKIISN